MGAGDVEEDEESDERGGGDEGEYCAFAGKVGGEGGVERRGFWSPEIL